MRYIFVLCSMFCASVLCGQVCDNCNFIRGDANCDGQVNLTDVVNIAQGNCANADACDANGDGVVDISDSVYLSTFLYNGGAAPPCPYPDAGLDCTPDNLETCCSPPTGATTGVLPDSGATHTFLPSNWDSHQVNDITSGNQHGKKFILSNSGTCSHTNSAAIASVKANIIDNIGFTRDRLENRVQDAFVTFDISSLFVVGAVCQNYTNCDGVNRLTVDLDAGQMLVVIRPKVGGATKNLNFTVAGLTEYRYTRTTGGTPCKLVLPASNELPMAQTSNISDVLASMTVGSCDEWVIVSVELINVEMRFERLNGAGDIATTEKIEATVFVNASYDWCTCQ